VGGPNVIRALALRLLDQQVLLFCWHGRPARASDVCASFLIFMLVTLLVSVLFCVLLSAGSESYAHNFSLIDAEVIGTDIRHEGSRALSPRDEDFSKPPARGNPKSRGDEPESPSDKYQAPITLYLFDVFKN
jgi:hypothetical protein